MSLCVVSLERHGDGCGWCFQLRREVAVAGVGVYEVDVLVKSEGLRARVVEFCAPEGGAGLVGERGGGGGVEAVLFAAEGADFVLLV